MADSRLVQKLHPSPNWEARRGVERPDLLLLHYTGMKSAARAIDWLSRPESKVSCHYVVDEHGMITQLVPEAARAWHAGVACWHGETDINSVSVGIEIHNPGHDEGYPSFPDAQMNRLAALCRDVVERWSIWPERVLAHSDVAPGRKIDPGEKFDWRWMHGAGIGHWVEPCAVDEVDLGLEPGARLPLVSEAQQLLAEYGYRVPLSGCLDAETSMVVAAFQRHFRPARVDGRIDRSTAHTLQRLVGALPRRAV